MFMTYICSTVEGIKLYHPSCLLTQHDGETATYIFILRIHCCSTTWSFTAHILLRTKCVKDGFCWNCRECALIEKKKLFLVSRVVDDWSVYSLLGFSLIHLLSTEMQNIHRNLQQYRRKEDPKIKGTKNMR